MRWQAGALRAPCVVGVSEALKVRDLATPDDSQGHARQADLADLIAEVGVDGGEQLSIGLRRRRHGGITGAGTVTVNPVTMDMASPASAADRRPVSPMLSVSHQHGVGEHVSRSAAQDMRTALAGST